MTTPLAAIADVAELNPSPPRDLARSGEIVAFVPMAAVSEDGRLQRYGYRSTHEINRSYSYFGAGDVLVAKITPCFENNKIALAEIDRRHGFGSTEFHVVRPRENRLDARYLSHFLRQDSVRAAGERRMTGSAGQRRVPKQFLAELEIPLPLLEEQRRIAAILDQAEALRRKRREAIELLDQLRSAAFSAAGSEWPETSIGEICDVRGGKRLPKGEEYAPAPTPYRYIRVSDLGPNGIDETKLVYLKPETQRAIARYTVEEGDIIISIAGSIGLIAPVPTSLSSANLTENAAKLVAKRQGVYEPVYLAEALKQPRAQAQIDARTGQVTIGKLALFRIEQLKVPLPPIDVQHDFTSRMQIWAATQLAYQAHLAQIDALFASLQHRAFRGELSRGRDAEELSLMGAAG